MEIIIKRKIFSYCLVLFIFLPIMSSKYNICKAYGTRGKVLTTFNKRLLFESDPACLISERAKLLKMEFDSISKFFSESESRPTAEFISLHKDFDEFRRYLHNLIINSFSNYKDKDEENVRFIARVLDLITTYSCYLFEKNDNKIIRDIFDVFYNVGYEKHGFPNFLCYNSHYMYEQEGNLTPEIFSKNSVGKDLCINISKEFLDKFENYHPYESGDYGFKEHVINSINASGLNKCEDPTEKQKKLDELSRVLSTALEIICRRLFDLMHEYLVQNTGIVFTKHYNEENISKCKWNFVKECFDVIKKNDPEFDFNVLVAPLEVGEAFKEENKKIPWEDIIKIIKDGRYPEFNVDLYEVRTILEKVLLAEAPCFILRLCSDFSTYELAPIINLYDKSSDNDYILDIMKRVLTDIIKNYHNHNFTNKVLFKIEIPNKSMLELIKSNKMEDIFVKETIKDIPITMKMNCNYILTTLVERFSNENDNKIWFYFIKPLMKLCKERYQISLNAFLYTKNPDVHWETITEVLSSDKVLKQSEMEILSKINPLLVWNLTIKFLVDGRNLIELGDFMVKILTSKEVNCDLDTIVDVLPSQYSSILLPIFISVDKQNSNITEKSLNDIISALGANPHKIWNDIVYDIQDRTFYDIVIKHLLNKDPLYVFDKIKKLQPCFKHLFG